MASTIITNNGNLSTSVDNRFFTMIENYIYLYHVSKFIVLPSFVDAVQDTMNVSFSLSFPLSRSAPIYSYQHSGPRTVQLDFDLHRDMMTQINQNVSNAELSVNDDYVDTIIKYVQAAAYPSYDAASRAVNPPIVAIRLGSDIFVKGVISGAVGVAYKYPVLQNGKYSNVHISLNVTEIDPYDASMVMSQGSYRYVSTTLLRDTSLSTSTDNFITSRNNSTNLSSRRGVLV